MNPLELEIEWARTGKQTIESHLKIIENQPDYKWFRYEWYRALCELHMAAFIYLDKLEELRNR